MTQYAKENGMKKFFAALSILLLSSVIAFAADAAADRERVWSRYLSPHEKAALSAMVPIDMEGGNSAPTSETDQVHVLAQARTGFATMAKEYARAAPPVTVTPYNQDGIKGSWQEPAGANREQVVLYLHGGAFLVGSDETPQSITAFLAAEAGVRCFSLDYPLAPEHPFPAAVDNALLAYRMLLNNGIKPGNIVVSGDSAGGGLSLALLQRIREDGLPMPAGAYLISPWADLTHSGESHATKGYIDSSITLDFLTMSAAAYAGNHDLHNPLISPVFADLRDFPPLLVQVGSYERLLDDSITLIKNAATADVPATLTIWPGYPHVFQFYHRDLENGRKALTDAARFVNEVMQ